MSRRSLLASLALALSACADASSGPTSVADPSLQQVGAAGTPTASSDCIVYPSGAQYVAAVTWSRIPTRTLRFVKLTLPSTSYEYALRHRTRSSSVTVTLDFYPSVVFLADRPNVVEQACRLST